MNGHYELFGAHVWFVWFVWLIWSVWFVWLICRAKFTPLNRVPFGKFNGAGGPHQWANHKLFEAVRPCFLGFSEQTRGCIKKFTQRSGKRVVQRSRR
ncbi:MAG: hypothetical protein DRH10_00315 [Deltaproteobacteria bacterium]|nr:MAG: hypothetical protein DRH10_00315 [Deltaproteobacteria bacterium]